MLEWLIHTDHALSNLDYLVEYLKMRINSFISIKEEGENLLIIFFVVQISSFTA